MTTLSLVFGIAALIWALGWTQAKGLVIARSER